MYSTKYYFKYLLCTLYCMSLIMLSACGTKGNLALPSASQSEQQKDSTPVF